MSYVDGWAVAHPSTASVPITVLLYHGALLCGFNVGIKELKSNSSCAYVVLYLVWPCLEVNPRDKGLGFSETHLCGSNFIQSIF